MATFRGYLGMNAPGPRTQILRQAAPICTVIRAILVPRSSHRHSGLRTECVAGNMCSPVWLQSEKLMVCVATQGLAKIYSQDQKFVDHTYAAKLL